MLSIIGSLIGFGSSIVPEVLGFFKKSQANKQELAMLEAKAIVIIWDPETQAIFAAIVSFWFGSRAFSKARSKK
jgi:GH24 family phage-related lysozyme (muramidase)